MDMVPNESTVNAKQSVLFQLVFDNEYAVVKDDAAVS